MTSNHIRRISAPVNNIPDGLLVDIFDAYIALSVLPMYNFSACFWDHSRPKFPVLQAALVLTHVCTQWRRVGWSYGRFWDCIMIRYEQSLNKFLRQDANQPRTTDTTEDDENCPERHSQQLMFQLARSKNILLEIHLEWDALYKSKVNVQHDLEQLIAHSTRWRSFTFLFEPNVHAADLQAILLPIKGKLPNLQTLVLSHYPANLDIFEGTLSLRKIQISRCTLFNPRLKLPWNVLTSLELILVYDRDDLAAILPMCIRLEELKVVLLERSPSDTIRYNASEVSECNLYPVHKFVLDLDGYLVPGNLSLRNNPPSLKTLWIDVSEARRITLSFSTLLIDCSSTLTELNYTLRKRKETPFKDLFSLLGLVPRLMKLVLNAPLYYYYDASGNKEYKQEADEIFRFLCSPSILPDLKYFALYLKAPYVRDALNHFIRSRWTLNENLIPSRHPTTGTASLESVELGLWFEHATIDYPATDQAFYWMVFNQGLKVRWVTNCNWLDVKDEQRFVVNEFTAVDETAFRLEGSFMGELD